MEVKKNLVDLEMENAEPNSILTTLIRIGKICIFGIFGIHIADLTLISELVWSHGLSSKVMNHFLSFSFNQSSVNSSSSRNSKARLSPRVD